MSSFGICLLDLHGLAFSVLFKDGLCDSRKRECMQLCDMVPAGYSSFSPEQVEFGGHYHSRTAE